MNKLTQEQKRVKIAEACGFQFTHQGNPTKTGYWYNPDHALCQDGVVIWDAAELPDYCGDLNAMHEAERWLATNTPLTTAYWRKVVEVVCDDADEPMNFDECTMFLAITANAEQRAEAFGRTLNLWEEGQ